MSPNNYAIFSYRFKVQYDEIQMYNIACYFILERGGEEVSLRFRLNVFQKRGLKKTLGAKREKLMGNWR
jgi:hypothetical protein